MDLIEELPRAVAIKLNEVLKPDEQVLVQLPGAYRGEVPSNVSRGVFGRRGSR